VQEETSCKKFPPATPFKNSYMAGGIIGASVGAHGGAPSCWEGHFCLSSLFRCQRAWIQSCRMR
jgi:hypothetical protein